MTSLIFGSIYLAHKGATGAYRDKQRRKNYERWEGLRDEYDAQKKITRESRSLDIQRTGTGDFGHDDRPIVSLRDLQEANDARTGWRPQESWEHHNTNGMQRKYSQSSTRFSTPSSPQYEPSLEPQSPPQVDAYGRPVSTASQYWQSRGRILPQKTGATWDEALPTPLRVNRQNFETHEFNPYKSSRSNSVRRDPLGQRSNSVASSQSSNIDMPVSSPTKISDEPVAMNPYFLQQLTATTVADTLQVTQQRTSTPTYYVDTIKSPMASAYPVHSIEPLESHCPGGRMAELIERGY